MSITVRNVKKEEFLNVVNVDEATNAAVVDKSYFETSADQAIIDTPIPGVVGANVAEALENLAEAISQAGKVDDVVNADGTSIVENKVAQMKNAVVKQAGKVASSLRVGGTNTSGEDSYVSFDGSKRKDVIFVTGEFNTAVKGDALEVSIVDKGYVTETELTGKGYATKSYTDTELAKKLDKAGGTVTGALAVNGGVTIGGNLTVNGTTTTVNSTTLAVTDKLIEVAHGNTTKLTTPAGIVVPKYDGTNSGALVFNGDGIASVGDVVLDASGNINVTQSSGLQPLATRTGLVNDNLVKYDGANKTLVDTGVKADKLVTTNTEQEITAAKTFKDEYGTVVINGEITYTPAAASIGGLNINNEAGHRVIGVFGNGDIGQLHLGSPSPSSSAVLPEIEAELLLKGEPGEDGQVLISKGRAKTPAWSSTVGSADSATDVTTSINGKAITSIFEADGTTVKNATHAGSADKVANALTVKYDMTGTGTPLATPVTYDGSAAKSIVLDSQFTVESTTEKTNIGIGRVKEANHATSANKVAYPMKFTIKDSATSDIAIMSYDGSGNKSISFTSDFSGEAVGRNDISSSCNVALSDTGVAEGVYTAVKVDTKGRTRVGQQAFAVIGPNDDIPSNVVIGGFVLRTKA